MTIRYAKIAMTLALAAFAFMTVFNNITDSVSYTHLTLPTNREV